MYRLKRFRGTKHISKTIWGKLKRFLGTKLEDLNNRRDQILFTALLVITLTWMLTWLPASVGARSLRCCAIRSLGIRRRTATRHCHEFKLQPL